MSARADIITRRTYSRPLNEEGTKFETWQQTIDRVIYHQQWLWERAQNRVLSEEQSNELAELRELMLAKKVFPSGRTLWLGGTEIAKRREASQFNCSFTNVETVYDLVDVLWLLLNGCGVGIKPITGTLSGFRQPIEILEVIRSKRTSRSEIENNVETWNSETKHWTIKIGDSAEAWAKSIGKLCAGKYPAKTLTLDFSEIRPAGLRLKGYGWISSGDTAIYKAYSKIFDILNSKADSLLTKIDIMDIVNLLGTILSSRRSAEIVLYDYDSPGWREFALAKKDMYELGRSHREQSNNSLLFYKKPTREQLREIFDIMEDGGGSEPGLLNMEAALRRAPWAAGFNPSLRKGTRVFTNRGIVPIETLENEFFEVNTIDDSMQDAGCKLSGKNKQLYKITLEGGHEYYATKEHTWPVMRQKYRDVWNKEYIKVRTDEIKPGDCLVNHLRDSLYPHATKGTYQDGFFIGWLLGDGWITKRGDNGKIQIGLILSDEDYDSPIRELLEKHLNYLGSKATFHKSSKGRSWELNTQNETIWQWLVSFGVEDKKTLPTSVFSSEYSEDFRKGFIDASFSSDGTVESTYGGLGIRIGITSCSKDRITDLADILGFYGIKTSITCTESEGDFPNGKIYNKTYYAHTLRFSSAESLKHFGKLFKLTHPRKQLKIETAIKNHCTHRYLRKIKIVSVEATDIYEDVFDIGVYNTNHTFQLSHGFTGNCAEVILSNKSYCNLTEIDIGKFLNDNIGLRRAVELAARLSYRQTCVNLKDGILQEAWHLNNQFLRLCGVGLTGIVKRPDLTEYDYTSLKRFATSASYAMANELDSPKPKNTTLVKPSGTFGKVMDTTEGIHKPLGKYIFNNVQFGKYDPLVHLLTDAGYNVFSHPTDFSSVLITLPVEYQNVEFDKCVNQHGEVLEVNNETAIEQLNRYKMIQNSWSDQNTSTTIYYQPGEKNLIIDWLLNNWDSYVGVSFLYKTDPSKTPEDLGYLYLPQQVVTKETYTEYVKKLKPIDLDLANSFDELKEDECATGACPIR